jgi:uncharacterized membrane protein
MQGKAKVLGHSIHPALIVFPLALLTMVPVFDLVQLGTKNDLFASVAFWMCTVGLVGGVVAAVPGFIDWLSIPHRTRAWRVGATHLIVNLIAVGLYGASWFLRVSHGIGTGSAGGFILALVGLGVMLVGGWYGGELVQQHGMSVRPEADLNAPSSLDEHRLIQQTTVSPPREPSEPQPA